MTRYAAAVNQDGLHNLNTEDNTANVTGPWNGGTICEECGYMKLLTEIRRCNHCGNQTCAAPGCTVHHEINCRGTKEVRDMQKRDEPAAVPPMPTVSKAKSGQGEATKTAQSSTDVWSSAQNNNDDTTKHVCSVVTPAEQCTACVERRILLMRMDIHDNKDWTFFMHGTSMDWEDMEATVKQEPEPNMEEPPLEVQKAMRNIACGKGTSLDICPAARTIWKWMRQNGSEEETQERRITNISVGWLLSTSYANTTKDPTTLREEPGGDQALRAIASKTLVRAIQVLRQTLASAPKNSLGQLDEAARRVMKWKIAVNTSEYRLTPAFEQAMRGARRWGGAEAALKRLPAESCLQQSLFAKASTANEDRTPIDPEKRNRTRQDKGAKPATIHDLGVPETIYIKDCKNRERSGSINGTYRWTCREDGGSSWLKEDEKATPRSKAAGKPRKVLNAEELAKTTELRYWHPRTSAGRQWTITDDQTMVARAPPNPGGQWKQGAPPRAGWRTVNEEEDGSSFGIEHNERMNTQEQKPR